jgi:hypothetical protein
MSKSYEIIDRFGRIVDDDDDVLRDGQTLRVPLHMRDHETLSPQQRWVMADKAARLSLDDAARRFGLDDGLALHKPGQRFSTDQAANIAREEARRQWIDEMCDAWRTPVADVGSGELRGARPGDKCTIDGQAGTLVRRGDRLVCEPVRQDGAPARPVYDAVEGQRVKDEAWLQMCRELEGAWRER